MAEQDDYAARMSELRTEIALGRAKYNAYREEMAAELRRESLRADEAEKQLAQRNRDLEGMLDELRPYIQSESAHICKGRLKGWNSSMCSSHLGSRPIIRILVPAECEEEFQTWRESIVVVERDLKTTQEELAKAQVEVSVMNLAYGNFQKQVTAAMRVRLEALLDLDEPKNSYATAEQTLLQDLLAELENISKHNVDSVVP